MVLSNSNGKEGQQELRTDWPGVLVIQNDHSCRQRILAILEVENPDSEGVDCRFVTLVMVSVMTTFNCCGYRADPTQT